jgi:hypothetical protein
MAAIVTVSRVAKVLQIRPRLYCHSQGDADRGQDRCSYCNGHFRVGEWVSLVHVDDEPNWHVCDECGQSLAHLLGEPWPAVDVAGAAGAVSGKERRE